MSKKVFLYLIIFLILVANINAFLISPPRIDVEFKPGDRQEQTITLFNNRKENINLETYVKYSFLSKEAQKTLNNSITLSTSKIYFSSSDISKSFTATINLPTNIPDGIHDIRIGAVEEAVTGVVGSRSANEVRLLIYSGDYKPGTTTSINKTSTISPSQIGQKPTEQGPASFEQTELSKIFTVQIITTFTLTFLILLLLVLFYLLMKRKKEALSIVIFKASYQKSDAAIKVDITVRNNTSKVIDNVYMDLQVINPQSEIVKNLNFGPIPFKPKSEVSLSRSLEHNEVKLGVYNIRLLVYYRKKILLKKIYLSTK